MSSVRPFESWWEESCQPEASFPLERLLRRFYDAFVADEPSLARLKESIVALLEHLRSAEGETEADLFTVDAFFCLLTADRNDLLERLPGDYQSVIDTIGMDLREGHDDPEMAKALGATPELLLEKAKALRSPSEMN